MIYIKKMYWFNETNSDRYFLFQEKQARIASLYLPLYGLILDNMPRFFLRDLFPIYFTASDQVRVKTNDEIIKKHCTDWLLNVQNHVYMCYVLR